MEHRLRAHFRSLASMHNVTVKFYNRASIFKFQRINYRIHDKFLIVGDEMSIVGSYDLDLRSTYLDTELMLAVKSRGLNEQIRGHIEAMAKECCALEPKTLTRIVRHARSQSKAFLRLITIRAKLDLSRTSGILLMPFRYLI